ncbi:MAG: hypothetical protein ABIO70_10030 [Pseudomonadota bacterium]
MHRLVARIVPIVLAVGLLTACGEKAADLKEAAQAALDQGDTATAIAKADAALTAAGADKVLVWQVQNIRLKARARAGDGEGAKALLAELTASDKDLVRSALYFSVANDLKKAQQNAAAIDVLDAGAKTFPGERGAFETAIQDLQKEHPEDPEVIQQLQQLGYLG